ncbi:hypothetical protein BN1110_02309 [bacterium YEK0313]|nr:hypothetical protein BN1110_02309 [bacterium YEK0313]
MTTMPRRPHGKILSSYDFGRTTFYASQMDPRFSYCAYVPIDYAEEGEEEHPLVVVVHGTLRDAAGCRDGFAAFAEAHRCIVLAPLFPAGITTPTDVNSYKLTVPGAIRYDLILLAMVDEMRQRYRIAGDRFALCGFSGGGHFSHRFLYLHPERLSAVSIGAPGLVTLLDLDYDYWVGVRNFETIWRKPLDIAAIRALPIQMVIGGDDTETWEITIQPSNPAWRIDWELAGRDRQQRMLALKASFQNFGIAVRHDIVPGVAHRYDGLMPAVQDFFGAALTADCRQPAALSS